jgi:biopolymer transport protein TolR
VLKRRKKESEINVTPLVDVMLVLLVIFMVATPMIQNQSDVNLPIAKISKETSKNQTIRLSILKDKILINDKQIDSDSEIISFLNKQKKEEAVFIYADKNLEYQKVIRILDLLNKNGFLKIALITKKD